jgi:hypothetical protein
MFWNIFLISRTFSKNGINFLVLLAGNPCFDLATQLGGKGYDFMSYKYTFYGAWELTLNPQLALTPVRGLRLRALYS